MAGILIERVTKSFGDFTAVDDLDIAFADGEVTCLLGPSGCGKTTLMRMIAGLESPTRGRILVGGRDVTRLPPRRRNVAMVFQYPVMYPTLTVAENIERPLLEGERLDPAERRRRVEEALDILDMRNLAGAFYDELDAGNRQKVAVGRAIARHSDIVLFDEPTTNVEVNAKLQLIRAFKEVTRRLRQTIVYVTHDQTEAMTLADKIALMHSGKILQYAEPRSLYGHPTTEFGGWFLGNPGMNFLSVSTAGGRVEAPLVPGSLPAPTEAAGGKLTLGIRPEKIAVRSAPGPDTVAGTLVDKAIGVAGTYILKVRVGAEIVKVKTPARPAAEVGQEIHLHVPPGSLVFFRDGRRLD
jgi:ABC-type sugar transport system ATPase subunit